LKGKLGRASKSRGTKMGDDAYDAGLNLMDFNMLPKKLLPLAYEKNKKAKTKRGWLSSFGRYMNMLIELGFY
jgi:hypothetical protein